VVTEPITIKGVAGLVVVTTRGTVDATLRTGFADPYPERGS
jgi:hypothetical protein